MPINDINRTDTRDNTVVAIGESQTTNLAQVSTKVNGKIGLECISEVTNMVHSFPNFSGQKYYTEDMLAIARNTSVTSTFTTLYTYTGAGYLNSFVLTLETGDTDWFTRIVIDSSFYPLFGTTGVYHPDLKGAALYNLNNQTIGTQSTIAFSGDTIYFTPLFPLRFTTGIQIQTRHLTGKRFRAGMISLLKD